MTETVARVFPRRTRATPDDALAFVGDPPLFLPRVEEVHVSCTFTWDRPEAERLVKTWAAQGYRVRLGGPAYDSVAGEFEPGMYVKPGMTITSRGCVHRCGFCFVPTREGGLRLLAIKPGWDVLDNNLLACPRRHIEAVFDMLAGQPRPARFTGGLDARLLKPWAAARIGRMRLDVAYLAYDRPANAEAVERAVKMLLNAGGWREGQGRRPRARSRGWRRSSGRCGGGCGRGASSRHNPLRRRMRDLASKGRTARAAALQRAGTWPCRGVAQGLAHVVWVHRVEGSNPSAPTKERENMDDAIEIVQTEHGWRALCQGQGP